MNKLTKGSKSMHYLSGGVAFLLTLGLSACGPASLSFRSDSNSNSAQGSPVCQTGPGAVSVNNGLSGSLYYLDPGSASLNSVDDYIATGHLIPNPFYFNSLDVLPEPFTDGFMKEDGTLIQDPSGNTLTVNFALDLKTQITLAGMPTGDYQFGVISDDGSIINTIDSTGTESTLINNDNLHPSQFGCAMQTIHFEANTTQTFHVKYYQGPANEISLMLLWKKIPAGGAVDTMYCGDSGVTTFFDPYQTPPAPQHEYIEMQARGWAPLQATNYLLPAGTTNPCVN